MAFNIKQGVGGVWEERKHPFTSIGNLLTTKYTG